MTSLTKQHYTAMHIRPLRHSFAAYDISDTPSRNFFGAASDKSGITLGNNALAKSKTVINNLRHFLLPTNYTGKSRYLSAGECCTIAHSATPVSTALVCVSFLQPNGQPTKPLVTVMNAGVTNPSTVNFTDYPSEVADVFKLHNHKHDKGFFGMFSAVAGTRDMLPKDFPTLGADTSSGDTNLDDSVFISPCFQEVFTPMGFGITMDADEVQDPHNSLEETFTQDPTSTVHDLPLGFKLLAATQGNDSLKGFVFSRKIFPFPAGTSLPPGIILDPSDPDFGLQQLKQACIEVTALPEDTWDWLDHIPAIDYWLQATQANPTNMTINLLPLSECTPATKSQLFMEEDGNPIFKAVHLQLSHMLYRDYCLETGPSYTRYHKWETYALEVTAGGSTPLETATHPALAATTTYFCKNDAWDKDTSIGLLQYRDAAQPFVPPTWLNFDTFEVKANPAQPTISELQSRPATPAKHKTSAKDGPDNPTKTLEAWQALCNRETPPCDSPPKKRVRIQPTPKSLAPTNLYVGQTAQAKTDDDSVIECFTAPSTVVRAGASNLPGIQSHSGIQRSPYELPCELDGYRNDITTRQWLELPVPKYHGTAKFNSKDAISNSLEPYIVDAAHLGAYRAPSTLQILRGSDNHPISWLDFNLPGVLGNQYITSCLTAKNDRATVTWLQRAYQYRHSFNPTQSLRMVPDIINSFWGNPHLPSALKSGLIQSGPIDILQESDFAQGISIWTMLGTVGPCKGIFKVPLHGLLCNDVIKVITNFYWFHALRYADDRTFTKLTSDKSPFTQYSILSANFLYLLNLLGTTNIRQRWDDHHQSYPERHQKLTACLLVLIGKLIDIFLQWAASSPSTKYEPVFHPQEPKRRDIVVIAERYGTLSDKSFPDECTAWRKLVQNFVDNLEDAGTNPARYQQSVKLESFFLTVKSPPPPRPDKRGGRGKEDKDKGKPGKDNATGKSSTATQYKHIIKPTDPNLKSPGKPFAVYLSHNKFKIEGKEFCFRSVGGNFNGCSPIRGKPCDRLHLNLDCEQSRASWSKAKLQPVWDFLQKEETKRLVLPTPEFETFFNGLQ